MNVEYIITSEFDMDKGPTILHYYPFEIPGNLNYLPEMMLPDQIHKRNEDSTVFLLHKNPKTKTFQYRYTKECLDEPFYCYTVANTKSNAAFKRGYVIKSLSIITTKNFFKNFKPLVVLALDSYFYSNNVYILKTLFDTLNNTNLSINYNISTYKKVLLLSILDLPINDKIQKDSTFKQIILDSPQEQHEMITKNDLNFTASINHSNFKIPIKIPMIQSSQIPDIHLKPLVTKLMSCKLSTPYLSEDLTIYGIGTPPIIILINALLTGKKIIFIGYEHTAADIVDLVFAAYNLINVDGLLNGFTKFLFPFIDLSKIDELEQLDFYLVGTANPIFKMNENLYDLIWDLDSNEFLISSKLNYDSKKLNKNSIISEDAKFLSFVTESLVNHHDEFTLQLICRRHINEILRLITTTNELNSGYFWQNESIKKTELNCYHTIIKKFHNLIKESRFTYYLSSELIIDRFGFDLQYYLQNINSPNYFNVYSIENQKKIWLKILTFLQKCNRDKDDGNFDLFLLLTYLLPNESFDQNKGFEIILINLFNNNDDIKKILLKIIIELRKNYLCDWILSEINVFYQLGIDELEIKFN